MPAACSDEPTEGWHTTGPAGAEAVLSTATSVADAAVPVLPTVIGSNSRPGGGHGSSPPGRLDGTGRDSAGAIMGESASAAGRPGIVRDCTRASASGSRDGTGATTDAAGSAAAGKPAGGTHSAAVGARALAASALRGGISDRDWRTLLRRMSFALAFLRSAISPSGHSWQWPQPEPFVQLPGFQYHAHGRQSPLACSRDPREGRGAVGGLGLAGESRSFGALVAKESPPSSSPSSSSSS
mmetsp:Transcript_74428/g.201322  ORF Transcript_74428/g.201322 Transcript_74428/m.201322 type:complete len:240 (-) Transcript_74428:353-1072(-)